MNILEVKNLTKKFRNVVAVNDISFELKEGEILGFLGPNGAGKTTTIQMLLGVLTPDAGSIQYFGKNLDEHREEILETVGFSSTYTELAHHLTVGDVMKYTSYFFDIKDRKKRIEDIKEIFQLERIFKKDTAELSSGQMTRANLAKAFLNFPRVLLLDEPTASLDPETASYVRHFLLKERKKFNVSIIITSHNMAEIEELCDRVVFISHGKIIANDSPSNLAKTVNIAHLELMVPQSMNTLTAYCDERNLKYGIEKSYISIDIEESALTEFLEAISERGIRFSEIGINKPTLHDYFLHIVNKSKNNES